MNGAMHNFQKNDSVLNNNCNNYNIKLLFSSSTLEYMSTTKFKPLT